MSQFSYEEMTGRNLGFVDEDEQRRLRSARVFVVGTGGMGGACLQSLARAGVGAFEIADFDDFEVSNLNRQVFSSMDTIDRPKAESTAQALKRINPEISLTLHGQEWTETLDEILLRCTLVVNGMDDIRAGIHLYRRARAFGCTVIDAYTSTLPSVTVVEPTDPRPEERLGFPTVGVAWKDLSEAQLDGAKLKELEYSLTHSSASKHVHAKFASQMVRGKRKRFSFAPMVITTGNLMAFEIIRKILGRDGSPGCRGYFFNPWTQEIERPLSEGRALLKRAAAKIYLLRLATRAD